MLEYNHDTEGKAVVAAFPESVKNKTFLITGISEGGLGAETAVTLALANPAQLILVGRSAAKIQPVFDAINAASPTPIQVIIFTAQLDSISSVRAAAKEILSDPSITHIDGLVNNAGVMGVPEFEKTEDGVEEHLGINHVSHFVLTNLLMPRLLAAGHARVINVSSYGHVFSNVNFDDPSFGDGKDYNPWLAYGASKTANILFSVELNKRFGQSGIRSYVVSPGSIHTNLGRHVNPITMKSGLEIHQTHKVSRPLPKTLQQGVSTGLRALLEPNLPVNESVYLDDCQFVSNPKELAPHAIDPANALRCWMMTEDLVQEKFPA